MIKKQSAPLLSLTAIKGKQGLNQGRWLGGVEQQVVPHTSSVCLGPENIFQTLKQSFPCCAGLKEHPGRYHWRQPVRCTQQCLQPLGGIQKGPRENVATVCLAGCLCAGRQDVLALVFVNSLYYIECDVQQYAVKPALKYQKSKHSRRCLWYFWCVMCQPKLEFFCLCPARTLVD